MEFFLSYHHADRVLARRVSTILEKQKAIAFLAHESIEVSREWRNEILKHISTCSCLIAVVTRNFSRSEWVGQEVGVAIGSGKPVVPLQIGGRLEGFLSSLQAVSASRRGLSRAISKVYVVIARRDAYLGIARILDAIVTEWGIYQGLPADRRGGTLMRVRWSMNLSYLSSLVTGNKRLIEPRVIATFDEFSHYMKRFSE